MPKNIPKPLPAALIYKVVLVDDHAMFRSGLKALIEKEPDFKVVAESQDGEDLLFQLKKIKCDLLVLDISMPHVSGLGVLKEIKQQFPHIKILMLTMQKDHEHFKNAMALGADGYVLKDEAFDQMLLAMRMILRGKKYVSVSVSTLLTDRFIRSLDEVETPSVEILTPRELEILKLIASGLSNKNVAAQLNLSVRTVESHRLHLMDKLGIKNTAHLVRYASAKGLI